MMIDALTLIAQMQTQLGALQLKLVEEQETPVSLDKCAGMARSLEDTAAALGSGLRTWATELREEIETDKLLGSIHIPYLEPSEN